MSAQTEIKMSEGTNPHDSFHSTPHLLSQLGPYQLLEKIGRGAMGTVYRARHTNLGCVVAVKLLPPERLQYRISLLRFRREMQASGRVQHLHVVRATDAGVYEGQPFLAMEFVDGIDVNRLIITLGGLPVADACEVVRQAALGLQAIHAEGLIHRDIKPSNLLIDRNGLVKVADLGLARICAGPGAEEELTDSGQVLGTASYIAPEQVESHETIDIRADLYSLGCTLYKLLTAQPPFSSYTTLYSRMRAHVEKPLTPLAQFRSDLPACLQDILNRLTAKSPTDRYTTPAEVADALAPLSIGANLPLRVEEVLGPKATALEDGKVIERSEWSGSGNGGCTSTDSQQPEVVDNPADQVCEAQLKSQLSTLMLNQKAHRLWWKHWWVKLSLLVLPLLSLLLLLAPFFLNPDPNVQEWQPLPTAIPDPIVGPNEEKPFLRYHAESRLLQIQTNSLTLIPLGSTQAKSWELSLRLQQNPWKGELGIFFGYHSDGVGPKARIQYQQLLVKECKGENPKEGRLCWLHRFAAPWDSNGEPKRVSQRYKSPSITLAGAHELHILVDKSGLKKITWDGQALDVLPIQNKQQKLTPEQYRGMFGVVLQGSATISKTQYRERKDR